MLLEKINSREDLLNIQPEQEAQLCEEIRQFLIEHVSQTGGHLSSNLGIVELSVAIEKVFDTSVDRLVFDVGHQSYVHKILTGRKNAFSTLRQFGGIAGFPKPTESDCDAFVAGHASSSVSTALGMIRARKITKEDYRVIALLGDGAMTGGLAYEGLNDAGASDEPLIVILNDNGMSITPNVGGIATHLTAIRVRPGYYKLKKLWRSFTRSVPLGYHLYNVVHRFKEWIKHKMLGMNWFEEMGFLYMGPVDGHDITKLIYLMKRAKEAGRPVLLHVLTKKGKGFAPAENNPDVFHGIGKFDPQTGAVPSLSKPSYSSVFGQTLCDLAETNDRLCAITAAMQKGTGLDQFAKRFPDRFFDVGIAEGHAVSMAGGMAKQGLVPVVAIYSTFLQRAFDMIIQDIAMLNLHVVFAIDRAGLVGEDGETHHGIMDVGYLSQIPNLQILCPSNITEQKAMLIRAVNEMHGPVAVRYPRGYDGEYTEIAESTLLYEGGDISIITYGSLINNVISAKRLLEQQTVHAEILKLASIKPLDYEAILSSARKTNHVLIVEETLDYGCIANEIISRLTVDIPGIKFGKMNLGDAFVPHGSIHELYGYCHLDANSIAQKAKELISE